MKNLIVLLLAGFVLSVSASDDGSKTENNYKEEIRALLQKHAALLLAPRKANQSRFFDGINTERLAAESFDNMIKRDRISVVQNRSNYTEQKSSKEESNS